MSREIKLGILAVISIFGAVWGYKFVKGQDLFNKSNIYYTSFSDVTALEVSSGVSVNGYKIGVVEKISINPEDVKSMDVKIRIDGDIKVPKDAKLVMKNEGLVGGKYLALVFDKPCTSGDCAKNGDKLKGETMGLIGSLMGENEVSDYMSGASKELTDLITKLGAEGEPGKVNDIVRQLNAVMLNMNQLTKSLDQMLASNQKNITALTSNLNKVTNNLAQNNDQISQIITSLNITTKDIASAHLSQTVSKTNTMIEGASETMKKVQNTLEVTNNTMTQFKDLAAKMQSSDGSLGAMMNDKLLYQNLESTSKNLSLLLQDVRLNPKRYVNVSVFGKKSKAYIVPEDDPAFQDQKQ